MHVCPPGVGCNADHRGDLWRGCPLSCSPWLRSMKRWCWVCTKITVVLDASSMSVDGGCRYSLCAMAGHNRRPGEVTTPQATTAATAFAMTVPPVVITTNCASWYSCIATNFFGQNTVVIASIDLVYDGDVCSGRNRDSADYVAASPGLTPFVSRQQDTNPDAVCPLRAPWLPKPRARLPQDIWELLPK